MVNMRVNKMVNRFEKIILISLDTLRADCIPSNPINLYKSEYKDISIDINKSSLDMLISKGVFFNNVIAAAPYTSASHGAIFTGLWPVENGLYDQFNHKLNAKTLFEIAKNFGFRTIFKTDFPLILGKHLGMTNGIDDYFIEDNNAALDSLREPGKSLAFFHFGAIHYPYGFHNLKLGGEKYIEKVRSLEKRLSIKSNIFQGLDDMAVETFRNPEDLRMLFRYKAIIQKLFREKQYAKLFNLYLEGINHFMSTQFEPFFSELFSLLEKSEDYLIIIFSDHGEAWSQGCYGHHNSLDEGVIRVPLIFYTPGINPMLISSRVRTIDIAPTLLDIMGYDNHQQLSGSSLVPSIFDNASIEDRDAYSQVWVTDIKDVVASSHAIINGQEMKHDAQNFHYKEAIYHSNYKYHKQYYRFVENSEELEPFSDAIFYNLQKLDEPMIIEDSSFDQTRFENLLLAYNIKKKNNEDESSVTENIRRYLNSLGYKV